MVGLNSIKAKAVPINTAFFGDVGDLVIDLRLSRLLSRYPGWIRYGKPMRAACADLTTVNLLGAHWLPLERKAELVQAIRPWLQAKNLSAARL